MSGFGSFLSGASKITAYGNQVQSIGSALGVNTSRLGTAINSFSQLQSALQGLLGSIENSTIKKAFGIATSSMVCDFREDPHYQSNSPLNNLAGLGGVLGGVNDTVNQISNGVRQVQGIASILRGRG